MAEFFQSGLGGGSSSLPSSTSITNLGLAASVGSNAMTIALKDASGADATAISPVTIQFRNSTQATGTPSQVLVTGALSTVISSGSTGGSVSATMSRMYVYLINNAGTAELAWAGSNVFDENAVVTTTAEGGAGAADSSNVMYSTTARSNVAFRYIGFIESTQATAGTWATTPSRVGIFTDCYPKSFAEYSFNTTNGYGSSSTAIRKFTNAQLAVDAGGLLTVSNSSTLGLTVTANRRCRIHVNYTDLANQLITFGVTRNDSQLTTDMLSITNSPEVLVRSAAPANEQPESVSVWTIVNSRDILRPHTGPGYAASATTSYGFFYVFAEEI